MKKKNLFNKSIISTFLVLALFAFKIADLHSYTHDIDTKKSERCELCLLAQNTKTGGDFISPSEDSYEIPNIPVDTTPILKAGLVSWKSVLFCGKSLNKAPPALFV